MTREEDKEQFEKVFSHLKKFSPKCDYTDIQFFNSTLKAHFSLDFLLDDKLLPVLKWWLKKRSLARFEDLSCCSLYSMELSII